MSEYFLLDFAQLWVWCVLGYLSGSVPYGVIFAKIFSTPDLRQHGSKNIGATNMMRVGGRVPAFCTLLCDSFKGAAIIGLAYLYGGSALNPHDYMIIGACAIIGHMFPVWVRFQGGKGVATTLGILLMHAFFVGVIACVTWLVVARISRYSSLAALVAMALAPLGYIWLGMTYSAVVMAAIAALIWYRHKANITRLLAGDEGKIS